MATHRFSILGPSTTPDNSGNCWQEPLDRLGANDKWKHLIYRFGASNAAEPTTAIGLRGQFNVPKNYVGTAKVIAVWTSTLTTGNVVWDFEYRAITGNDTESLDQAGVQEAGLTVTDAAPTGSMRRLEASITLTAGNFAADDTVQFELYRDGTDAADTLAGSAILVDLLFEYADA